MFELVYKLAHLNLRIILPIVHSSTQCYFFIQFILLHFSKFIRFTNMLFGLMYTSMNSDILKNFIDIKKRQIKYQVCQKC